MRSFEDIYNELWNREKFINVSRFKHTVDLLPPISDQTIVSDIASGKGYFADYLTNNSNITRDQLTCYDISPLAIDDLARNQFKNNLLDIETGCVEPVADIVFFLEAIEHVLEPDRVLQNLYRSLKPGGYLIISTPNYAKINRRIRMLLGFIPEKYTSGNHHISMFSVWFLKKRLLANGFVIDKENNLFEMESLGRVFKRWLKPHIPYLKKKFPLDNFNYIPATVLPNLMADLVLIRARKPLNSLADTNKYNPLS